MHFKWLNGKSDSRFHHGYHMAVICSSKLAQHFYKSHIKFICIELHVCLHWHQLVSSTRFFDFIKSNFLFTHYTFYHVDNVFFLALFSRITQNFNFYLKSHFFIFVFNEHKNETNTNWNRNPMPRMSISISTSNQIVNDFNFILRALFWMFSTNYLKQSPVSISMNNFENFVEKQHFFVLNEENNVIT